MSTTYETKDGDTLEVISRIHYGDANGVGLIKSANPSLKVPFTSGITIKIPDRAFDTLDPAIPDSFVESFLDKEGNQIRTKVYGIDLNDVSISVNGRTFNEWNEVTILRSIDSIDRVDFVTPMNKSLSRVMKPFSFSPISVYVGGVVEVSGTMVQMMPDANDESNTIQVGVYSKPGVLSDCSPPINLPLEFYEQNIKQIAFYLCAPFGIDVVFRDEPGAAFSPSVECLYNSKVLAFLSAQAKKRGLIIRSDRFGRLEFFKSTKVGAPVATLKEGGSSIVSITPRFSPQSYYSDITGIKPVIPGIIGDPVPVVNPRLKGVFRPYVYKITDTQEGDILSSVEAKMSRMFADAISYTIVVDSWLDPRGNIWKPNTTIVVEYPSVFINKPYEFIIKTVSLKKTDSIEVATLSVVLPGAFSSGIVETLPWDE